jgi:hypothetical protein
LSPLLVALCLSGQHAMAFELSLSIADFERSSLSGNDNTGDYLLSLPIWSFLLTALSTEPSLSRAACVFEHIRWRCHTFAVASSTASQWNTACPASLCAFITSWIIRGRPRGALMAVNRLRAVGMLSELERLAQIKYALRCRCAKGNDLFFNFVVCCQGASQCPCSSFAA